MDPLIIQCAVTARPTPNLSSASPAQACPPPFARVEHLRGLLPVQTRWLVAAAGAAQLPMTAYCILAGGHVRTGLEDNLHYRRGERAANAQLVERVKRLAAELERPIADAPQARALLGLQQGDA